MLTTVYSALTSLLVGLLAGLDNVNRPAYGAHALGSHWRTLVLGALIATMPFSGMRVICVGTPAAESTSSVHVGAASECERLCPLHEPSSDDASDCALSADGLSLIASAGVAVVRAQEPPQVPDVVRVVFTESPRFLPEPELPRFGPPPKPQAL